MRKLAIFLILLFSAMSSGIAAQDITIVDDGVALAADDDSTQTAVESLEQRVPTWGETVSERLGKLLQDRMFTTSMVGLEVYDLTADSLVYAYNEKQTLRPASTMKVVTLVTALDKLGASYTLDTKLYYTGTVTDRVLNGNIYIKGGMDPMFGATDMAYLVGKLSELGIDTICGNICADVTMKDSQLLGAGWCWDDDNPVLTPLLYEAKKTFLSHFRTKLSAQKIFLNGTIMEAAVPGNATLLATRSHGLTEVMMRMMKNSNNTYAEAVFYQLAAASTLRGQTVSAKVGRSAVNELIRRLGMNTADYYVADGSGLSLYNYLSPELEVRFLRYAWSERSRIWDHLYKSMPIAGVDGTLGGRMKGTKAAGNVHAKTGTLTGISTLAGYCRASNGNWICFSIMNSGIRESATGRRFQDRVCEAICK